MSSRNKFWETAGVIMCLAAALVCYKLLVKHITGSSGSSWFEAGCMDDGNSGPTSCETVLASPYSYVPPKFAGEPEGTPHTPVAFFGLTYYCLVATWILGIGRPSRSRRWVHLFPLLIVAVGLMYSARFVRIMFTELEQWCLWCMVTHGLNLLIAVCVIALWPRKTRAERDATGFEPQSQVNVQAIVTTYPSAGRMFAVIGIMMLVWYANYGQYAILAAHRTTRLFNICSAQLMEVRGNPAALMRHWKNQEPVEIIIRPDDPFRTSAAKDQEVLEVVVFSDFQCPSCAAFADFFENSAQPLFDGRLKLVYKHYPLDTTCNPMTSRSMHVGACEAAKIAEAARILGGEKTFWSAHDVLFEAKRKGHTGRDYDLNAIALKIGVDDNELGQTMNRPAVAERISADARMARSYGVQGTPTVFVQRKKIHTQAKTSIEFWNALAEQFWQQTGTPRPAHTLPSKSKRTENPGAIPGSQDQPNGS